MNNIITPKEIQALVKLPRHNNVIVFDIGCAYGCYISEVLKCNNNCMIHGFEPIPKIYTSTRNTHKDNLNIKINNCVLMDSIREIPFHVIISDNTHIEGCSSTTLRKEFIKRGWEYDKIMVESDTLDRYVEAEKIAHIDWMKIDVEGAEPLVIIGGKNVFENKMVDVIQFEYSDTFKDAGFSIHDMFIEGYVLCDFNGEFVEIDWINDYKFNNYFLINKKIL